MTTLWVSTRKGLFRLERGEGGFRIESVSFLGDSVSLALHDRRDDAVYAALNLGHFGVKLRRSTDRGRTWEELGAPAFPEVPEGVADTLPDGRPWPWVVEQVWALEAGGSEQPGTLWCGTVGGGLFRSDDFGKTWSLNRPLWDHPGRKQWFGGGAGVPGIHSVCVHPGDAQALTVAVSCGGVWQTSDGGVNWEQTANGMFAEFMPPERTYEPGIQDVHRVVQCSSDPSRLWAQHHNAAFRSDDGGRNWVSLDLPPSVFGFPVAVHPKNPDVAWYVPAIKDAQRVPVAGNVVVSRTQDGGKTWEILRRGLPQGHAYDVVYRHALDVDATGDLLAFGSTTGALWVSENGGESFEEISAHLPPIYAVRFGGQ